MALKWGGHWFNICQSQSSARIENELATFIPTKPQVAWERSRKRREQPQANCWAWERAGHTNSVKTCRSKPERPLLAQVRSPSSGVLCFQVQSSWFSNCIVPLKQNLCKASLMMKLTMIYMSRQTLLKTKPLKTFSGLDDAWVQIQLPVILLFLWPTPPHFLV